MGAPFSTDLEALAEVSESVPFWRSVLQALSGAEHDYTSGQLNRAVLLLAVPMILEMVMESLFALSDVFWVSRLGKEAVAVVGLTESIMTIIYALAIGVAIAGSAFVARRIGAKDPESAAQAAGQVLLIGASIATVLGLVLGFLAPDILRMMGATPEIVALGTPFARIMYGGNFTVFLIFLMNAIFRGSGDPVMSMRTLWLANGINIVLGPCLIFGWGFFPALGVTGAALATNLGRGTGVLFQLWHLLGRRRRVRLEPRHFVPDGAIITALLRMAGSGITQMMISMTSWIGLMKIMALFGNAALAGYVIAMRLVVFALLPAWGLAGAGATLVGQNLGAKKPERAEAAVWLAVRFNTIFLGCFAVLFICCHEPIIRLFSHDPEVIRHGSRALWTIGMGFPLYATGMCMAAAFNGAGDTWVPTATNLLCYWICEVPLAWLLARHLGWGPNGVFTAIFVAFTLWAVCGTLLFRRGRWKLKTF